MIKYSSSKNIQLTVNSFVKNKLNFKHHFDDYINGSLPPMKPLCICRKLLLTIYMHYSFIFIANCLDLKFLNLGLWDLWYSKFKETNQRRELQIHVHIL